ncbi:MAG: outer membrane beta-barrel protein [Desulfobacterales bacterium]|nr:outer membrane beta-barrel protein [Desulfobacterales bacterium]
MTIWDPDYHERKRILFIAWAAFVISIYFPVSIFAASKFNIQPKIYTSWELDSNFYLAEFLEREIYTYKIRPGFKAEFEGAKTYLMLDYTLDAYYYDDRDTVPPGEKPADDEDYLGHTFTGEARYQAFDRLLAGLNGSYYLTRDPAQSDNFSNSIDRDKYTITRLTPLLFYKFGDKFNVGLRYRHTDLDYIPEDREDSKEQRGIFDLIYNFTPKTSLDFEFQHWQKEYTLNTSDYTSNQAQLIFKRQFRVFNLEAGAGYQNRNFDDPGLDDLSTFLYHLNFGGEGLIATRKSRVSFNVEQNLNDQSTGNNYFIATRFVLNAQHEFTRNLLGEVGAYYQISNYQDTYGLNSEGTREKRKDDTYDIFGKINYKYARWLIFSVTGGYEKRDANIAGLSYNNTYFIASLGFVYDLGQK